jgi:hypothetical protein
MFRSYDDLQEENILLARITQLTTDPLVFISVKDCLLPGPSAPIFSFHHAVKNLAAELYT